MIRTLAAALATSTCIVALATPAAAQTREYNIPAGSLKSALDAYVRQSGRQVVYRADQVRSARSPGTRGQQSAEAALAAILSGSGFTTRIDGNLIAIVKSSGNVDSRDEATSVTGDQSLSESETADIIVTGSRIRGNNDQFSPVLKFGRDDFDRSGFKSAGEFIAALPQNFGGGISVDTAVGSTAGPGATTVNLRGLDAGGTLTLINGRRLAPNGLRGSFVDIGAIPTSALERVEVLTDGASAIYGSDAVAGVVNFILRKDYNGAETRLRAGTLTQGDGDEFQIAQTFGRASETARGLISIEYTKEDPLLAADKPFSKQRGPTAQLLPETRRLNIFGTAGLKVSDTLELSTDAFYSNRHSNQATDNFFGAPPILQRAESIQYGGTVAADVALFSNWKANVSSGYAKSSVHMLTTSTSETNDQQDSGTFYTDLSVEWPIAQLGGGALRGVFGYQYRRETFSGTSVGQIGVVFDQSQSRDVHAVFGEVYAPLVTESNRSAGLEQLAFSFAGRYEHYSFFGSTFNPKAGAVYSPIPGIKIRGTYGTSFRAPILSIVADKISFTNIIDYIDQSSPTGISTALNIYGERLDLKPEKSESWTLGLDLQPNFIEGFEARFTYFHIDYTGRIDVPTLDFVFLPNGGYAYANFSIPEVRNPALADLQDYVRRSSFNFNETSGSSLADVSILLDNRSINTVATRVSGLDVGLSYRFTSSIGTWQLDANASYIDKFDQQFSDRRPVVQLVDRVFRPTDLRFRAGANWSAGGAAAALFANYTDSYLDDQTGPARKVKSWLTVDASIQYRFGSTRGGMLDGLVIGLSAQNLFDAQPPELAAGRTPVVGRAGFPQTYDSANADPQGRRIALQLTKRW